MCSDVYRSYFVISSISFPIANQSQKKKERKDKVIPSRVLFSTRKNRKFTRKKSVTSCARLSIAASLARWQLQNRQRNESLHRPQCPPPHHRPHSCRYRRALNTLSPPFNPDPVALSLSLPLVVLSRVFLFFLCLPCTVFAATRCVRCANGNPNLS